MCGSADVAPGNTVIKLVFY